MTTIRIGEPDTRPTSARATAKANGTFGYVEPYVQRTKIPEPDLKEEVKPRPGRVEYSEPVSSTRPDWARGYPVEPKPFSPRFRTAQEERRYVRREDRRGLPSLKVEGPPANRRPVESSRAPEPRPDYVRSWE